METCSDSQVMLHPFQGRLAQIPASSSDLSAKEGNPKLGFPGLYNLTQLGLFKNACVHIAFLSDLASQGLQIQCLADAWRMLG